MFLSEDLLRDRKITLLEEVEESAENSSNISCRWISPMIGLKGLWKSLWNAKQSYANEAQESFQLFSWDDKSFSWHIECISNESHHTQPILRVIVQKILTTASDKKIYILNKTIECDDENRHKLYELCNFLSQKCQSH